jgi:DegV family protein with EDD domain
MRIGVVTDSASDLPAELIERCNITVVPLDVRLGANPVDLVKTLDPVEFWKLAQTTPELPETSAPSPGAFVEAFRSQLVHGAEAVVCITISSALSATYEAARQASAAVAEEIHVEVIDSRQATMGEGLLVLEAVELASSSTSIDQLSDAIRAASTRVSTFGTLDTLENLRRGGRIGGAQAFIGTMLQVKPVVEVRDGVVEAESRQRTRGRSLRYLADKVNEAGPLKRLAVMHAAAKDVDEFCAMLSPERLDNPLVVSFIGPVIGAHTGLGTIGACFLRA